MAMRGKPKTNSKKIGDRELNPATLMMGLGYDPVLSEGSLVLSEGCRISSSAAISSKRAEKATEEVWRDWFQLLDDWGKRQFKRGQDPADTSVPQSSVPATASATERR